MRYFTWKLELVSNILWMIVVHCLKITVLHVIPDGTILLNCLCNVFWQCTAFIIALFLKKNAATETTAVSNEKQLWSHERKK